MLRKILCFIGTRIYAQTEPKEAYEFYIRGLGNFNNCIYDRAINDFTEALRLDPSYEIAYYDRGKAYLEKGDYDKAIMDFSKTIQLKPNDARGYFYRGFTYANGKFKANGI